MISPRMFHAFGRMAVLAASLIAAMLVLPSHSRADDQVTALVPAYFYPTWWSGSPWDQLNAAATTIPIEAIMNPASGPGSVANSDYQYAVTQLQAAGGKVLGYVPTGYGFRSIADVMADVQSYIDWYSVDGIFLDEMGNSAGALDYVALYGQIKALATSLGIDLHVVGNPGNPFTQVKAYLAAADTLVIFEGPLTNSDPNGASFQNYPNNGPYAGLPLWFKHYSSDRFANIVFAVPNARSMGSALSKAIRFNAGYVYLTDDNLPNPYDTLPSYWQQEVNRIASINDDR